MKRHYGLLPISASASKLVGSALPVSAAGGTFSKGTSGFLMSEKATGNDWMSRSKYRVVHGAGGSSYIEKGYSINLSNSLEYYEK